MTLICIALVRENVLVGLPALVGLIMNTLSASSQSLKFLLLSSFEA